MKIARTLPAKATLLCLLFACGSAVAQTTSQNATLETFTVTGARPVSDAMDVIERRYGVLIDYVDPLYLAPQDMQIITAVRGIPVKKPFPVPKVRTLSFQYKQVNEPPKNIPYLNCPLGGGACVPVSDWPQGGITALIQKVLDQFAADGGQVFGVRKLNMSYGPRWDVYPERVRDQGGTFGYQPDVLSAIINIPEEKRTWSQMLGEILSQLTASSGREFGGGTGPWDASPMDGSSLPRTERGADNITAEKALAQLLGQWLVLRINSYAPDDSTYVVNIVNLPNRPLPRPPNPPPPKPPNLVPQSQPVGVWMAMAGTPKGVLDLQTALAKAGFLHAPPTTHWDKNAADAIRRLQAAYKFPVTGKLDELTIIKLEPYLPKLAFPPPPSYLTPNPLGRFLLNWLQSTRRGQMDIQRALTEEGFYSGALTGAFDLKTRNALTAYQKANGLTPTGIFDDETSRKLAPLLLKMKD
ncbi:MAG TPA: peptidoglycan-binding domain-containing protein [Patescibacteria group bacterium]|nr:peptidoglycan-binding domain-containing protein [Patescibacteria group bacterium]